MLDFACAHLVHTVDTLNLDSIMAEAVQLQLLHSIIVIKRDTKKNTNPTVNAILCIILMTLHCRAQVG